MSWIVVDQLVCAINLQTLCYRIFLPLLDDFLTKYCIISEGQANYYRRIFKTVSPFLVLLTVKFKMHF